MATDTERLDYVIERASGFWIDKSSGSPRYSADGGDSWHEDPRAAIDAAMAAESAGGEGE